MLALTQCLLDANGTGPAGTGGGGTGGDDEPTCVEECTPSSECMVSRCEDGRCVEGFAPPNTVCGENADKFCDEGACKAPRGAVCGDGEECLSGHCVDGYCCDVACDGTCEHCDAPGQLGECTVRASGEQDPDTCDQDLCDGIGSCSTGEASWAWSAGDDGSDDAITAVATSPDGSSWVALQFDGTATVAGTPYTSESDDVLLVKLSNTGAVLETIQLGGAGTELVTKLAVDGAGNVYAGGYFSNELDGPGGTLMANGTEDAVIVSLDGTGAHRWTKHLTGSGDDRVFDLIALQGGGIAAVGSFEGILAADSDSLTNASLSSEDGFAYVVDAGGTNVWLKAITGGGTTDIQAVSGICQTPGTGELYVIGTFEGAVDLDATLTSADDSFDLFVAELDLGNAGNVLGGFRLGNDSPQESRRIGCLPDGDLVVTGHFFDGAGNTPDDLGLGDPINNAGSADIFAAILAPTGMLRQRLFAGGASGEDRLQGLAVDPAGNFTFAGLVRGPVTVSGTAIPVVGMGAVVAAKYTATGTPLWVRGYDSTGFDGSDAVATNDAGLVWLGGLFEDPLTFTPGTNMTPPMVTSEGGEDGFVVRLSP